MSYRIVCCCGGENVKGVLSQELSNMQSSVIKYSHPTVHYIPMTDLFYDWSFEPFD